MITDFFIRKIKSLDSKDIPERVFYQARCCFLDFLGVALAGSKRMALVESELFSSFQDIYFGTHVIGNGVRVSPLNAALINGINSHVLELDDGHRIGMLHLGAPIISALLAVAEKDELEADRLLFGIIIGYEVAIRLACCIQPGNKLKGYHATGTCGTIGATMGIAAALDFDYDQMKSALSASVTSSAGILEMIVGDSQLKPFNAGRAAMDGVMAAYVGRSRFKAPEDALGGERGFLAIMTENPKLSFLSDWPEGKFMIETIYMKPYAACRHCHPSIEASFAIRKDPGFNISNIDSIHVSTYQLAVSGHNHVNIQGCNSAKMSIPYSIAVSLATGRAGMEEFTEKYINDPDILSLARKVTVSACDELTALCPQRRVAVVEIKMLNGNFVIKRVDFPKGEPENPLTQIELKDKFRDLARFGGLSDSSCEEIISEVFKDRFDLSKILRLLCLEGDNDYSY